MSLVLNSPAANTTTHCHSSPPPPQRILPGAIATNLPTATNTILMQLDPDDVAIMYDFDPGSLHLAADGNLIQDLAGVSRPPECSHPPGCTASHVVAMVT